VSGRAYETNRAVLKSMHVSADDSRLANCGSLYTFEAGLSHLASYNGVFDDQVTHLNQKQTNITTSVEISTIILEFFTMANSKKVPLMIASRPKTGNSNMAAQTRNTCISGTVIDSVKISNVKVFDRHQFKESVLK